MGGQKNPFTKLRPSQSVKMMINARIPCSKIINGGTFATARCYTLSVSAIHTTSRQSSLRPSMQGDRPHPSHNQGHEEVDCNSFVSDVTIRDHTNTILRGDASDLGCTVQLVLVRLCRGPLLCILSCQREVRRE